MITPALLITHNPFPSCLTSSFAYILRSWWNWISMDLPNLVIWQCIPQTLVLRDSFCCLLCSRLFLHWLSKNERAVYNSQGGDPFLRRFYCGCLQCDVKTIVLMQKRGSALRAHTKSKVQLQALSFFPPLSVWLAFVSGWLRGEFSFSKGGGWGPLCGVCAMQCSASPFSPFCRKAIFIEMKAIYQSAERLHSWP